MASASSCFFEPEVKERKITFYSLKTWSLSGEADTGTRDLRPVCNLLLWSIEILLPTRSLRNLAPSGNDYYSCYVWVMHLKIFWHILSLTISTFHEHVCRKSSSRVQENSRGVVEIFWGLCRLPGSTSPHVLAVVLFRG